MDISEFDYELPGRADCAGTSTPDVMPHEC
jgi:hypothetical protein